MNGRLPRPATHGLDAGHAPRHWSRRLAWLVFVGGVVGTTLRRPLGGDWSPIDVFWTFAFGALAGLLVIPWRAWELHAHAESRELLAKIVGDTLFVFPRPGAEQRIPLLGATALVRGDAAGASTEIRVERGVAIPGSFAVDITPEEADAVIAFVNDALDDSSDEDARPPGRDE